MDLEKILALINAASQAYSAAVAIAKDASATLGDADQATLQTHLTDLKAKSDADHDAIQAQLAG